MEVYPGAGFCLMTRKRTQRDSPCHTTHTASFLFLSCVFMRCILVYHTNNGKTISVLLYTTASVVRTQKRNTYPIVTNSMREIPIRFALYTTCLLLSSVLNVRNDLFWDREFLLKFRAILGIENISNHLIVLPTQTNQSITRDNA